MEEQTTTGKDEQLLLQQQIAARLAQGAGGTPAGGVPMSLADLANHYDLLALRSMMAGGGQQSQNLGAAGGMVANPYAQAVSQLLLNPAAANMMALQGAAAASLINPYPYAAAAAFLGPNFNALAPAMLLRQQLAGLGPQVPAQLQPQAQPAASNGQLVKHHPEKLISQKSIGSISMNNNQQMQHRGYKQLPSEISIFTTNGNAGGSGPPSAGITPSPIAMVDDKSSQSVLRSPEAVEQHISKLISENEAIVQPSPVLIRKRNSRYYAPLNVNGKPHAGGHITGSMSPRTGSDSGASSSPQMSVPADPSPFHKPFSGVSHTAPRLISIPGASEPASPSGRDHQIQQVFECSFCRLGFKNEESLKHHELRCGHPDADIHRKEQQNSSMLADALLRRSREISGTEVPRITQPILNHRPVAPCSTPSGNRSHPLKKRILAAAESFDLGDLPSAGSSNDPSSPRNALCPTPPLVQDTSRGMTNSLPQPQRATMPTSTVAAQSHPKLIRPTPVMSTAPAPAPAASQMTFILPSSSGLPGGLNGQNLLVLLSQEQGGSTKTAGSAVPVDPYHFMLRQPAVDAALRTQTLSQVVPGHFSNFLVGGAATSPVIFAAISAAGGTSAYSMPVLAAAQAAAIANQKQALLASILQPPISLTDAERTMIFEPCTNCPPTPSDSKNAEISGSAKAAGSPKRSRQITSATWCSNSSAKIPQMTSRPLPPRDSRFSNFAVWPMARADPRESKLKRLFMSCNDIRAKNAYLLKNVLAGSPGSHTSSRKEAVNLKIVWSKAADQKKPPMTIRKEEPVVHAPPPPVPAKIETKPETTIRTPASEEKPRLASEEKPQTVKREAPSPTPRSPSPPTPKRIRIFDGAYKSLESYAYVPGRGKGRYICGYCEMRCTKPSVLKKHLQTHLNIRPFECETCHFAFKTKGNLTKHQKAKGHGNVSFCFLRFFWYIFCYIVEDGRARAFCLEQGCIYNSRVCLRRR